MRDAVLIRLSQAVHTALGAEGGRVITPNDVRAVVEAAIEAHEQEVVRAPDVSGTP